jgi:hypothetical protein
MREELLVLRYLFDLDHGGQALVQNSIEILGPKLKLLDSNIRHLLIVCLNIEDSDVA